jgi:exonuclease SbcD
MKILHTSDWHIGRTFHGHSTLAHFRTVAAALVNTVRERDVDVVVVAGDIFDSATPAADNYAVLSEALREIRAAGAEIVMTSGNHDSSTRLGFQSEFVGLAGIHIITRQEQHSQPVTLTDEHGPVHFYGIPYLEPSLIRHHYPDAELRTHAQVLGFAMDRVRSDLADRGGRSVVVSHCFAVDVAAPAGSAATGSAASGSAASGSITSGSATSGSAASEPSLSLLEATDVERDITSGGLDLVPLSVFDGPDYVALGHIHGRARLSERARYSGAPLHYSFSEAGKPRGGWLVSLTERGLGDVEWVDLPVPRRLTVLTGDIEDLLTDEAYVPHVGDWVSAILTDRVRPMDGMRRLQHRFPYCVTLEHRPREVADSAPLSYTERVRSKTDAEIVAGFLEYVRNGVGPSEGELRLIGDVISEQNATESAA